VLAFLPEETKNRKKKKKNTKLCSPKMTKRDPKLYSPKITRRTRAS